MNIDFSDFRNCACLALRRLSRGVTAHYEDAFRGSGLRATQFTLLAMLAQTGPLAMNKLAGMLGLDRTTLNRARAPLERRKLLTSRDPRVRLVEITRDGRALAAEQLPRWRRAQATIAPVIARHAIPSFKPVPGGADDL